MRILPLLELRPPLTKEEKVRFAKAPKQLTWRGVAGFIAVLLGALACNLQESIGIFALPDFQGAFNVTPDQSYWTLTSFVIGTGKRAPRADAND